MTDMPDIKALVMELHEDQERAWKANQALLKIVTRASAPEAAGPQIAAEMASEMNARTASKKDDQGRETGNQYVHPRHVRKKLCYLLGYVATGKEIPALVECLGDFYLRESARFALQRSLASEATPVLIAAMDEVGPEFRMGVLGALAERGGAGALEGIRKAAGDADAEVAINAIEVMPRFADASCDDLIRRACHEGEPAHRMRAWKARIRLAEALAEAGNVDEAKRIYKAVAESDVPAAQKKAVEIGHEKIA
jgi:hypothetical protein